MRVSLGRRIAIQGALALLLVLAIPFAARAAGEEEIRNYIISIDRLYESLDYERALNRIQLARQVPRGTKEEVTLSLYEGIILCEMGKQGPGTSAFKSALFLRPDAQLPVQVAPKVEQLFESVRKQVKREMTPFLEQHKPKSQPDKTELVRESTPAPRATGPSTPAAKMEVPTNPAPPTVAPVMPNAEARSSPMAPKQESRADTVQTPSSGCQAAVSIECERLLKRLLQLQEEFLRTTAFLKLGPIEELAEIARQIRAARTSEELQEAAQSLDSWKQQHLSQ